MKIHNAKRKINTIFIGTPNFGIPALRGLIKDEFFDIIAVITQPDKKVGRKHVLTQPPIKEEALKYNIPILQSEKILNLKSEILNLKPDLIIVAAYAQIIPQNILDIPKYGAINIHGSLLPRYRGASCIQAAILNNDKETGATIMKMDANLDTGPILARKKVDILEEDTAGALYKKISKAGADVLIPTLKKYIAGKIKPRPQNDAQSSYVGLLKKQDGKIDWSKSAFELEKFVRAVSPWPSAWTNIDNGKMLKILKVKREPIRINKYKAGETFLHNSKLAAQCGQDALIIEKLQIAGKKEVESDEFIQGYKNIIGAILQ